VTSPFGVPRDYDGDGVAESRHEGLDLRAMDGSWEPVNILAIADGVVVYAGNMMQSDPSEPSDYGNYIIIQHDNGLISWSAHLENMVVSEGWTVDKGDVLGLAGSTGNSTGIHLHLTIQHPGHGLSGFIVGDVLDPAPLLGL